MPPAILASVVDPFLAEMYAAVVEDQGLPPDGTRYRQWPRSTSILGTGLPCETRVDEYDGPNGRGWVLVARVSDSGVTWMRAIGYGPELRDMDWSRIRTLGV